MLIDGMECLTKDEMQEQYEVLGFAYGYCVVKRKADNVEGTLNYFTDDTKTPWVRYYYDFVG